MPLPVATSDGYTYRDYLTWPDGERWEIIGGEAFSMTPSPSFSHQWVVGRLHALLVDALRGHACVPCVSPLDVVLSEANVVQPDVLVVCDRAKITPRGIVGAPDLVVEVLSASTALRDRRDKRELYQRFGVREYLLVDAEARVVEQFVLGDDGNYGKPAVLGAAESLRLRCLGDLEIALCGVFEPAPLPATEPSPQEGPEGRPRSALPRP